MFRKILIATLLLLSSKEAWAENSFLTNPLIHSKFVEDMSNDEGRSLDDYLFKPVLYRRFDQKEWKKPDSNRLFMTRDLILHWHLIGMNKGDVKHILGEPDEKHKDSGIEEYELTNRPLGKGNPVVFNISYKENRVDRLSISRTNEDSRHAVQRSRWVSATDDLNKLEKIIDASN